MQIPLEDMREILDGASWIETEFLGVAPDTDDLANLFSGVFRYKRKLYRVEFRMATQYYRSSVGPWDEPFVHFDSETMTVQCELVKKVRRVVYVYEPVKEVSDD